jgi:hypothetical protein
MSYLILIRRIARGLPAILCAAGLACSSGPTDPTLGEGPQMEPVPAPPVIYLPGTPQPNNVIPSRTQTP